MLWGLLTQERGCPSLGPIYTPQVWFPNALFSSAFGKSLSFKFSQIIPGSCHGIWNTLSWNIFISEPALWAGTIVHPCIPDPAWNIKTSADTQYLPVVLLFLQRPEISKQELHVTWKTNARP